MLSGSSLSAIRSGMDRPTALDRPSRARLIWGFFRREAVPACRRPVRGIRLLVVSIKSHWEQVYASRESTEVSWYESTPTMSLALVAAAGLAKDASIIDVGGGASTLVDRLLDAGFTRLTVLDIAAHPLRVAQNRLGARASSVTWLEADVLTYELPERSFDLWHDRAVYHFLTGEAEQQRYVQRVERALRVGGNLVLATFASDGPTRCSGLDVARHTPEDLAARFADFELVEHRAALHRTPAGREQRFVYCRLVYRGPGSTR